MVNTYIGKNTYDLSRRLDQIQKEFIADHGDLAVERIDASAVDTDSVLQAVQSLPFLADKKLVIIKNISSNNELLERIQELSERTADGVDVYIADQGIDKRKTSYKDIKKHTNVTEFAELRPHDIASWATKSATEKGATISRADAQYLVDRTGGSQQQIEKELEKLALYTRKISRESIDLLTDESLQSSIFALLDAAFAGDKTKVLKLYRSQRDARVDPHYIMAMITWQLHLIGLAIHAPQKTESALMAAGQSANPSRKALQIARSITAPELERYVNALCVIEVQLKSSITDPDAALELFFLEI